MQGVELPARSHPPQVCPRLTTRASIIQQAREDSLCAAFVAALPGIFAASASTTAAPGPASHTTHEASLLDHTFLRFVAGNPPPPELRTGCEQYLAYAAEAAEAADAAGRAGQGTAGLEAPCRDFLSYLEQLRSDGEAGEAVEAAAATTATTAAAAASSAGPGGPPSEVAAQQGVQWYSAADAAETVARLRSDPLTLLLTLTPTRTPTRTLTRWPGYDPTRLPYS